MRRAGQVFYALAALLVIVGFVINVGPGHRRRSRVASSGPVPATVGTAVIPTSPDGPPTSVRAFNTPPAIAAPATIRLPASGTSPVPGLDISDAEARPGDSFGVLVYSGQGTLTFGVVDRLRFYAPNGGRWVPFVGAIDAVDAALRSLRFTPDGRHANPSLTIVASDLGHQGRFEPRSNTRTIVIVPTSG